ncbi:hypothetical protein Tco_1364987 [Tanacetum coccineum]
MVVHNEDGNPARANIKQALGSYERPYKGVKASANSDIVYFFTSAQDGDPLQDDSSLIPWSRGSFDVIVGMDWLSKRKFVIVCHEKVVRIPLEGDEILQVHGERTQGVVKTLMNTKVGRENVVIDALRRKE